MWEDWRTDAQKYPQKKPDDGRQYDIYEMDDGIYGVSEEKFHDLQKEGHFTLADKHYLGGKKQFFGSCAVRRLYVPLCMLTCVAAVCHAAALIRAMEDAARKEMEELERNPPQTPRILEIETGETIGPGSAHHYHPLARPQDRKAKLRIKVGLIPDLSEEAKEVRVCGLWLCCGCAAPLCDVAPVLCCNVL